MLNASSGRWGLGPLTLPLVLGCGANGRTPAPPELPTVAVRAIAARPAAHAAFEDVVGTVRARTRAVVEPNVAGRIEAMEASLGKAVKAGDLLVRLDARDLRARLDQARAVLFQADRDLSRVRSVVAQGAASRQELDAAEARHRVARATVTEAETTLGYARVLAPFDGAITRKLQGVGDLAAPGKPLLEIEAPGALRFEADVGETLIDRVKVGDKLSVRASGGQAPVDGVVAEVAPAADPASRTFLVKIDLPADSGFRAGQFGRVSVPLAGAGSLTVPASAVVLRGQLEYVLVVADGRARLRLVRTGKRLGADVELLSGAEANERLVAEGGERLRDGQPVRVQP